MYDKETKQLEKGTITTRHWDMYDNLIRPLPPSKPAQFKVGDGVRYNGENYTVLRVTHAGGEWKADIGGQTVLMKDLLAAETETFEVGDKVTVTNDGDGKIFTVTGISLGKVEVVDEEGLHSVYNDHELSGEIIEMPGIDTWIFKCIPDIESAGLTKDYDILIHPNKMMFLAVIRSAKELVLVLPDITYPEEINSPPNPKRRRMMDQFSSFRDPGTGHNRWGYNVGQSDSSGEDSSSSISSGLNFPVVQDVRNALQPEAGPVQQQGAVLVEESWNNAVDTAPAVGMQEALNDILETVPVTEPVAVEETPQRAASLLTVAVAQAVQESGPDIPALGVGAAAPLGGYAGRDPDDIRRLMRGLARATKNPVKVWCGAVLGLMAIYWAPLTLVTVSVVATAYIQYYYDPIGAAVQLWESATSAIMTTGKAASKEAVILTFIWFAHHYVAPICLRGVLKLEGGVYGTFVVSAQLITSVLLWFQFPFGGALRGVSMANLPPGPVIAGKAFLKAGTVGALAVGGAYAGYSAYVGGYFTAMVRLIGKLPMYKYLSDTASTLGEVTKKIQSAFAGVSDFDTDGILQDFNRQMQQAEMVVEQLQKTFASSAIKGLPILVIGVALLFAFRK